MGIILNNGPGEICGRQPLKDLKWYGLPILWLNGGNEHSKEITIAD